MRFAVKGWPAMKANNTMNSINEEKLANARLIASAPDLLTALQAMLPIFDAFTQDELSVTTIDEAIALLPQARTAIARATGNTTP